MPPKEPTRNAALQSMRKSELIKTIKSLDKRITKLLNEVASLKTAQDLPTALLNSIAAEGDTEHVTPAPVHTSFPWETDK